MVVVAFVGCVCRGGGGVINILYPWKSKGLYRIWWLWHLWGCVCVGGGGVINILYPWKSKGLYRIWWLWHLWGVCVWGGGGVVVSSISCITGSQKACIGYGGCGICGVCVCGGGVSSISCIPGSQKACIGYGGCGICGVCVWGGGGVINILYHWKSKGLYRIWWLWHLWGVCVGGGVSSISCVPGSQKACIGYGGCGICGVCVCVWGGCHQYPVSLEVKRLV